MPVKPLTERDYETMGDLRASSLSHIQLYAKMDSDSTRPAASGFVKPLDIGGGNGSHHSATLKKLARRGLVEVYGARMKDPGRSKWWKAGCHYRLTELGEETLAEWEHRS
jgi:hypothetical protein